MSVHSIPAQTRLATRFSAASAPLRLRARIYPGVSLKVEEMMPDSPAEGHFAEGEILTGINGFGHKTRQQIIAIFPMPNQ